MKIFALLATFGSLFIIVQAQTQNLSPLAQCNMYNLDIVFVLDVSISIEDEENFQLMKDFIMNSTNLVTVGLNDSLAAVILFARHAWINFTLTEYTDKTSFLNAVNQIRYNEISKYDHTGTNTPEALDLLRTAAQDGRLGLRHGTDKIVVFITDGRPNTNHLGYSIEQAKMDTKTAANKLHELSIYDQFYVVGIKGHRGLSREILRTIAGSSNSSVIFNIDNFTNDLFSKLTKDFATSLCCKNLQCPIGSVCKTCDVTGLPYCEHSCTIDNGGCSKDALCTEMDAPSCNGECCSRVYTKCCELAIDLTFVLDVSVSIGGDKYFNKIKDLAKNVSLFMDIGYNESLVGVILFARDAWIHFDLQKYPVKADLVRAIDQLVYSEIPKSRRTGTNIPAALTLLGTAGQKGGALRLRDDKKKLKIAAFITDGRTLIRNDKMKIKGGDITQVAANDLHDFKIYDQIYAVGIRASKDIDFRELKFIATDESKVFIIDDFSQSILFELQRNLTDIVCNQQNCPAEGQIYSRCAPECVQTCSNPSPSNCAKKCKSGCHCPNGTILDEIQNKCVPMSKCRCPPQCSHDYCTSSLVMNSQRPVPCMRGPPPYNETDCMNPCKLTYCNACYYCNTTLPTSSIARCTNICEDRLCLACVREWAVCAGEKDKCKETHKAEENFKCYDYYGCD